MVDVKVLPSDVPDADFKISAARNEVILTVHSGNFRKELIIPLSSASGYLFLQTDKPIYSPKQIVHIHAIAVNERTLPSHNKEFQIQIKDPDDNIVEEKVYQNKHLVQGPFIAHLYKFPLIPKLGQWTVVAHYGYQLQHNTIAKFELREYGRLSTFVLNLTVPEVILPHTETIEIFLTARYVYGKEVKGYAAFRFGIKDETGIVTFFNDSKSIKMDEGIANYRISTKHLKEHRSIGWFPQIDGSHLVVKATVTDQASGEKESLIDHQCRFSEFPLIISFKRSLRDFKPGLISTVEVDVMYINGNPAPGVTANVSVVTDNNMPIKVENTESISSEEGQLSFQIYTEMHHARMTITVKTVDSKLSDARTFMQEKFASRSGAFIAIARISYTVKPKSQFSVDVHFHPPDMSDVYYVVVARGLIVEMRKLPEGKFKVQNVNFLVDYSMAPSFRVVVFAHHNNDLIADSLKVDVENQCNPSAEVMINPQFLPQPEPGGMGVIELHGMKDTFVGLLAVHETVYDLQSKYLLTKAKMFDTIESNEMGCGPGGGRTTNSVLGNAGVAIVTNYYSPPEQRAFSTCKGNVRKRRQYENSFAEDELQFISEEDEMFFELRQHVQADFRETWIFQDIKLDHTNKFDLRIVLPHDVTTWVIQAVSVSPNHGMCVSEPRKVLSFKKIFLHLNLPNSVVRNEQFEIPAIVFNYGFSKLHCSVYMYGSKDLCSGFLEDEKSERKRIIIEPQSTQIVTFPLIPLRKGEYKLKVVALSGYGSDSVSRKLNVILEGRTVMKEISVLLDPSNTQMRKTASFSAEYFNDSIDEFNNSQVTVVKLAIPDNYIPGSESCMMTVSGDECFQSIETVLQDPEAFLRPPHGNGEQIISLLGPTTYIMNYFKAKDIFTSSVENGFHLIREGIESEYEFRKFDGSYAAYADRPSSTWLTAYVMKVFCQARKLIPVDEHVICRGIQWLVKNQLSDGSFADHHSVVYRNIMGGVGDSSSMTAFVLIALQECTCSDVKDLEIAITQSVTYLEKHLDEVSQPLNAAIIAYALALSGSKFKFDAYRKLTIFEIFNKDENMLYWSPENGAHEVEITSYGLLTQLQYKKILKSNAIVKWLNNKKLLADGPSIQDTVIALQAMSEYEIATTNVNLEINISSDQDRYFQKIIILDNKNFFVQSNIKIDKVMGTIFIHSSGLGRGKVSVKLKYNVPDEDLWQYDISVNVTVVNDHDVLDLDALVPIQPPDEDSDYLDIIDAIHAAIDEREKTLKRESRSKRSTFIGVHHNQYHSDVERFKQFQNFSIREGITRIKRGLSQSRNQTVLNIKICIRYLGNDDSYSDTVVEAGVFSGFQPIKEDLEKLVLNNINMIRRYEITNRGVVFYLESVPKILKYCLAFRIKREYIVGNTLTSTAKVFDYYEPDRSRTIFYSAGNTSPMLHKICNNGICQCAEGGCPPKDPFRKISDLEKLSNDGEEEEIEREMLRLIVCEENDYTWRGQVVGEITREAGFLHVPFQIEKVIKEGIEKGDTLVGAQRTLVAIDNCLEFIPKHGNKYIVMGKDGLRYLDDKGNTWHRYLLDKTSSTFALKGRSNIRKLFTWLQNQETKDLCKCV